MAADDSSDLAKYFRDHAITFQKLQQSLLTDEIFLLLAHVPDTSTGPVSVQPFDPINFPAITFPSLDDLNLTPLELVFAEFPEFQTQPVTDELPGTGDAGGRHITTTSQFTQRETVPGRILSGAGDTYSIEVYPNGLDDYLADDLIDRDPDNIRTKGIITAKHPQMDPQAVIPANTWVWVWRLVKVEIIETAVYGTKGDVLSKTTQINQTSLEDVLMHPVWV